MAELITLPVTNLHPNTSLLREVDRENPEYLDVKESIKRNGILTPIRVTLLDDDAYDEEYMIVFGHNRWAAAVDLGIESIDCILVDSTEDDNKIHQIIENTSRVVQNPVEVRNMLLDYMSVHSGTTVNDLSVLISKPVAYIKKVLTLQKLANEQIEELVANGTISATNAYNMAKLDPFDQEQFVDQASCMGTAEFAEVVEARVKEVRDARRAGGKAAEAVFTPKAKFRKMDDLKAVVDNGVQSDDFKAGVAYAISLDAESVAERKAEWDAKQEAVAAKKAEKENAREAKKAEARKRKAEKKQAEAELAAADAQAILDGKPTSADIKRAEKQAAKEAEAETGSEVAE